MVTEKLIIDYCSSIEQMPEGFTVEDIFVAGEWVMFTERSSCENYRSKRKLPLLDIVAWVYSKIPLAV